MGLCNGYSCFEYIPESESTNEVIKASFILHSESVQEEIPASDSCVKINPDGSIFFSYCE